MYKRVVITGIGMVSPLAASAEETWSRLLAGESGAGPITKFDTSDLAAKIAFEVKPGDGTNGTLNKDQWIDTKDQRRFDDFIRLFQTNGDWISVGVHGYGEVPVAPSHVSEFDGHSAFCVLLHVPGGRQAAISYLGSLRAFAQLEHVWVNQTNRDAWISTNAPHYVLELNTNLPQFPKETEWALARRLCVINTDGHIQQTPITESIQLRRYLKNDKRIPDQRFSPNDVQQFFEFQLDRRQGGALRAVGQKENGFPFVHFRGQGRDLFEVFDAFGRSSPPAEDSAKVQSVLLDHCFECHSDRGIFSVLSYTGFLSPPPSQQPTDLAPVDAALEARATIYWKQRQFDWGLFQGLWRQAN